MLAQEQPDSTRPIAYASCSLLKHERNYGLTELEGLGVVWAVKHFHPYLYGNQCIVYTDNQALKSLLNMPQLSGKLALWGWPFRRWISSFSTARGSVMTMRMLSHDTCIRKRWTWRLTLPMELWLLWPVGGNEDLAILHRQDEELTAMIVYLETSVLLEDTVVAQCLTLTQSQFLVENGVLYWVAGDATLRVVPPTSMHSQLFQEVHGGQFGGHLSDTKVHSQLQKHYWWSGVCADITRWSRACLVCAMYSGGRALTRPLLTPIPVSGPFDCLEVDVIQFQ